MVTKETAPAPRKLGRPPLGTEGEVTTRILAAAKPIFLREGYDATSIDAIAASASISKKTVYARFASKEDLFEAVVVSFIEENIPSIERVASEGGLVGERLHRIATAILEVALEVDCIAVRRIAVAEAVRFPGFARLIQDVGVARVLPMIERCLDEGNRSGEIEVNDIRHVADLFLGVAVRGFIEKAELGLERPGLSHVKRDTLRRSIDFFMAACRPKRTPV